MARLQVISLVLLLMSPIACLPSRKAEYFTSSPWAPARCRLTRHNSAPMSDGKLPRMYTPHCRDTSISFLRSLREALDEYESIADSRRLLPVGAGGRGHHLRAVR